MDVCDAECLLARGGSGDFRGTNVERITDDIGRGCLEGHFSEYFGIAGQQRSKGRMYGDARPLKKADGRRRLSFVSQWGSYRRRTSSRFVVMEKLTRSFVLVWSCCKQRDIPLDQRPACLDSEDGWRRFNSGA